MLQVGRFGGHFFADRVYVIATDGRIERIDGGDYEQELAQLLPEDAVLTVSYPSFSGTGATLYTVPKEPHPGPGQEARIFGR